MSNKPFKQEIGITAVLLIITSVIWYQLISLSFITPGSTKVTFFDVGQGDAIFISTSSHQHILIDGGPDSTILRKLGETLPFYDRTIDLIILTHPHADHLFGLIDVLKTYRVKQVMLTGIEFDSELYQQLYREINTSKVPVAYAHAGQIILFNSSHDEGLVVLYPFDDLRAQQEKNLNNSSIVLKYIGDQEILFTGDAEKKLEKELMNSPFQLTSDILKAGHHGSKTSSNQEFIEMVSPREVIISVGENTFHHPSLETIKRFARQGIQISRTDIIGDIMR